MKPVRLTKVRTTYEWLSGEACVPIFGQTDGLRLAGLAPCRGALFVGMPDKGLRILLMDCVHDVEEVNAVRDLSFREGVRHELHELAVLTHLRPKVLDTELVVVRHVDAPHLVHPQQAFLPVEDLLEEIFVDHSVRRHFKLH